MDRPERRYQINIEIYANSKDEFITELQDLLNIVDLERDEHWLENSSFVGSKFIFHTEKFNPEMTPEKYEKDYKDFLEWRKKKDTQND